MGSKLSVLLRRKPAVCHPLPPLLRLPPELILMIRDYLITDSVSTCSLAITCKYFYSIIAYDGGLSRLEPNSRNSFLCLLERDLGDKFYLCCSCSRLHRFYKWWGPTESDSYRSCDGVINCAHHVGRYRIGYHHVRLVMHHHRSGGTKGIPLKNLNQTVRVATPSSEQYRYRGVWQQDWSARIINNELFLSARHTLEASNKTQLILALESDPYTICRHISIYAAWEDSRPAPLEDTIEECWEEPYSCNRCLTDYILTVERPRESAKCSRRKIWRVSITTYHCIGDGMSNWDWKWQAYIRLPHARSMYRHPDDYPPDLIREMWNWEMWDSDLS